MFHGILALVGRSLRVDARSWQPHLARFGLIAAIFDWILNRPEGFCIFSFFVLIPNVAAVLALFMRWGAVPLGVALAFGLFFGTMMILRPRHNDSGYFIGFAMASICILCHMVIVMRIRLLATT